MKKYIYYIVILLVVSVSSVHAFDLEKRVVEFKLKNGMRWLIVERHQAPVFSGVVMLKVGGVDEKEGQRGIAHIFEHMAFKGSSKVGTRDFAKEKEILAKIELVGSELTLEKEKSKSSPKVKKLEVELKELSEEAVKYQVKNEVWEIFTKNGAVNTNAYTSKDVTAYFLSMPADRLPLWLDITSQMVSDPVYREFYTERNVILEEQRDGTDNDPDGKMSETLLKTAFKNGPYNWPVIGTVNDISKMTIADARTFHDKYYIGGNMVGVLVGDFKVEYAKKQIEKYFGNIPSGSSSSSVEKAENGGGGHVTFKFDASPAVAVAWHKETLPNEDEFVFDVIQFLMCDGPTSRLQKRFIYKEKTASSIYCTDNYPGSRLNNLFLVWAETNLASNPGRLSSGIKEELDSLKTEPVSDEELLRVKNKVAATVLYSMENNLELASTLAEFETVYNDWRLLFKVSGKIEAITKDDIMRVANKYFTKEGLTEIVRLKK